MQIDHDVKLDYSDVLLIPNRSTLTSRSEVDLTINIFDQKIVPVIAANMDGVGTFEMAREMGKLGMMVALTKHYSLEDLVDFYTQNFEYSKYTMYSLGTSLKDREKFVEFNKQMEEVDKSGPSFVCVDVANGYTRYFEDYLTEFAETFPQYVLVAGNVVTPEQTDRLIECGVNIVKIGLGPGSVCTTRKVAGVGCPQFSAVHDCAIAAHDAGGLIIADGGITCPGDAAKAFGAGADMIMLGGYLAGHDEGGGVRGIGILNNTVEFYGMASKEAQDAHNGGIAAYRASEGKIVRVPYRGAVQDTLSDLMGGIRSACTYIGAESISEMHRKARFVRVNRQLNNVFGS